MMPDGIPDSWGCCTPSLRSIGISGCLCCKLIISILDPVGCGFSSYSFKALLGAPCSLKGELGQQNFICKKKSLFSMLHLTCDSKPAFLWAEGNLLESPGILPTPHHRGWAIVVLPWNWGHPVLDHDSTVFPDSLALSIRPLQVWALC